MSKIKKNLDENFYTVLEFADYVGVISVSGVYKKIHRGIIPAVIFENKTYIPKTWVQKHYDDAMVAVLAKAAE